MLFKWFRSYDQDGCHAHISEISRPMTFQCGIQHLCLKPYKVCSNDDPGLILTNFTARLTLFPNAFIWKHA